MKSHIFESCSRPWNRCFPESFIFLHIYTAHQGGLVLLYSPESLTSRKMWRYKLRLDITRFHMRLKACAYAYRKKGMVILPRGNARYISSSVACVQLIQELVTLLFFHYITTLCGNTMVRLFFPSHHFYLFPMKINVTIFCSSSSSCCCFRLFICFFSFLI